MLDSDTKFEDLVIYVCQKILGMGAMKFSQGKDGGRDSRFSGCANSYPSEKSAWSGNFIIQAKFTAAPTASISDSEFNRILTNEIPKVKALKQAGEVDNYLLFTNRKSPAGRNKECEDRIKFETGIQNAAVIGVEGIDAYLLQYPAIAKICGLDIFLEPMRFYEKDLRDVIDAFDKQKEKIGRTVEDATESFDAKFISKEEKNQKNKLSEGYFQYILDTSLPYFNDVQNFLKDEKNLKFREAYQRTVIELQGLILVKRGEFGVFEEIFLRIYQLLSGTETNHKKAERRNLIYVLLHFMYFNCDLGIK